jgi:AhpD family alkylhydroperoxidase
MNERISFADAPKGMVDGMMKLSGYLSKSLDHKLLALLDMRVSQINGCAYCLDMHYKDAIHLGETEQRLYSLPAWRETPYYTDKERAVLAFAEAVTLLPNSEVSDEVFNELAKFYSKAEIADLTLAVGMINTWNRVNKTFRTIPGNYKVGMFG